MRFERRSFIKKTFAAGVATLFSARALGSQAPLEVNSHSTWDVEADVVIVGSGIAGMCAAIEAFDAGAKVIVIEKENYPGGVAIFSGGHMTVAGTDVEARAGVEDEPDWLFADMMEDSEGVAVPELIRKFVNGGPEHIVWLQGLGIRFEEKFQDRSNSDRIRKGIGRGHMIAQSPDYPGGPHRGGLGVMVMLLRAAEKRGIKPLLQHKMTRVLPGAGGNGVAGLEVAANGKLARFRARRGVIITTGGWSGNLKMGLTQDPRLTEDIFPDCWPYHLCLGEGHLAAVDVGAELSNMAFGGFLVPRWGSRVYQLWEPQSLDSVPSISTGVSISDFQRVILVKSDGGRFVNEMLGNPEGYPSPSNPKFSILPDSYPNHPFIEAYLNLPQRPRNAWAITDADGAKALGWLKQEAQLRNPNPRAGNALYPGMVAIAQSASELAAKMKVSASGLANTISRYNSFVDRQTDADFNKPSPKFKIAIGPFYAVQMALIKHTRRNGIRVNTLGQVIDRSELVSDATRSGGLDDEKVIPHLYAAGECASYLGRFHGHGTLGIYSYYGRVAGKIAAKESLA